MNAFVYDGIRTARGAVKPTGSLIDIPPIVLITELLRALDNRIHSPLDISEMILGCVTQTKEQGGNIARAASLMADMPAALSAMTLNNFCCSGLDACQIAGLKAESSADTFLLAGGVESMSRVAPFSDGGPYYSDAEIMAATDFSPLWSSADFVATSAGVSREDADLYAVQSQQLAYQAQKDNRFKKSIVPLKTASGFFCVDEAIKADVSIEKLATFESLASVMNSKDADAKFLVANPKIKAVDHIHHVGSAPALADAASLILIGSELAGTKIGLKPRARIIAASNTAADPIFSLTGGIEAGKACLNKAAMSSDDIDLFEFNEAYAAVCLLFMQELNVPREKINVNGGAIALGHPMGATGGILLCTLLDELERQGKSTGMIAISGASGLGTAMIIERV